MCGRHGRHPRPRPVSDASCGGLRARPEAAPRPPRAAVQPYNAWPPRTPARLFQPRWTCRRRRVRPRMCGSARGGQPSIPRPAMWPSRAGGSACHQVRHCTVLAGNQRNRDAARSRPARRACVWRLDMRPARRRRDVPWHQRALLDAPCAGSPATGMPAQARLPWPRRRREGPRPLHRDPFDAHLRRAGTRKNRDARRCRTLLWLARAACPAFC